jgi:hypothetical protein
MRSSRSQPVNLSLIGADFEADGDAALNPDAGIPLVQLILS